MLYTSCCVLLCWCNEEIILHGCAVVVMGSRSSTKAIYQIVASSPDYFHSIFCFFICSLSRYLWALVFFSALLVGRFSFQATLILLKPTDFIISINRASLDFKHNEHIMQREKKKCGLLIIFCVWMGMQKWVCVCGRAFAHFSDKKNKSARKTQRKTRAALWPSW